MKEENPIFEKAVIHELCEKFGFDEGRFYYLMLSKRSEEYKAIFSYSKRYRVLKDLYNKGVFGKYQADKDFFTYFPLPIDVENPDMNIFLRDKYMQNYSSLFNKGFIQIIVKKIEPLKDFLGSNYKAIKLNYVKFKEKNGVGFIGSIEKVRKK